MPIKLNGATSGSVELDVPAAVGSDLQLTLPATAGEVIVKEADGSVDLGSVDIDSSGRLLVGTSSSPSAGQGQYSRLVALGGAGTTYGNISFGSTAAAASLSSGDNVALLCFTDNAGNTFARIDCAVDATPATSDYPGRLVFSTTADGASTPSERMRITSDGSLFLYTLSGSVSGMANIKYDTSTKEVYYDTSSRLAKENIADLKYGLDAVKAIQPRTYTAIGGDPTQEIIGFIADELVSVVPEVVFSGVKSVITGNDEDTEIIPLGISYDSLIPVLVKALQEAMTRIETLETKVAALEATP